MRAHITRVVFDLHGVLFDPVNGGHGMPVADVIAALRDRGMRIAFVTNSSTMTPVDIVDRLHAEGIEAECAEAASAGSAMARFVAERYAGRSMLLVGQPRFRRLVESTGAVRLTTGGEADVVVVGRDPHLAAETLEETRRAAARHAILLATSREPTFRDHGMEHEGPGVTLRQVEAAMQTPAEIVGKPAPYIAETIFGWRPADLCETVVVGDSLEVDVAWGARIGAATAWLAGPAHRDAAGPQPDWVLARLDELLALVEVGA